MYNFNPLIAAKRKTASREAVHPCLFTCFFEMFGYFIPVDHIPDIG
jgi:hypothetical protein